MNNSEVIKRKHHHVWSYYLKQWSANRRDVFYTTKEGKVAFDSTKGLAREDDFYKISFPNEKDILYIRRFSSGSPDDLREIHESFLSDFAMMSRIDMFSKKFNAPDDVMSTLKAAQHNILENLHSSFESNMLPVFKQLCVGNQSVLDNKESFMIFMSYLGHQISRSKAFKDKSFEMFNIRSRYPVNAPYSFEENLQLMNKNWWFISFMFGINIGASLLAQKNNNNHIFIENNTSEPFITTDNPMTNIHESLADLDKYEPPEDADFLYPLSPKYAYMINDSNKFGQGRREITKEEVKKLNVQIALKANNHIFSTSKNQLLEIKREIKNIKKSNKHFIK